MRGYCAAIHLASDTEGISVVEDKLSGHLIDNRWIDSRLSGYVVLAPVSDCDHLSHRSTGAVSAPRWGNGDCSEHWILSREERAYCG